MQRFTKGPLVDKLDLAAHSFDDVYPPQRDNDFNKVYYQVKQVVESAISPSLESGKLSTTAPQKLEAPAPVFLAEFDKFMTGMQNVGMTREQAASTWSNVRAGLLHESAKPPGALASQKYRHFDAAAKMMAMEFYKDPKAVTPLWNYLSEQFIKQFSEEAPVHVYMLIEQWMGRVTVRVVTRASDEVGDFQHVALGVHSLQHVAQLG